MVAQTTELCIVKGYREYCFPSGRNDQEDQEEMFQAEEKLLYGILVKQSVKTHKFYVKCQWMSILLLFFSFCQLDSYQSHFGREELS